MYRVLTENAHYISRDTAFSGNTPLEIVMFVLSMLYLVAKINLPHFYNIRNLIKTLKKNRNPY